MFLSDVSPGFSLALGSRGRLEGLVGKFEIVCEEFEENEGGIYWVNVF